MIKEYEHYHGAFLRSVIVDAGQSISIKTDDSYGLINTYVLEDRISLFLKHSTSRLAPWTFNFHSKHIQELLDQAKKYETVFICLICGKDGVAVIPLNEFVSSIKATDGNQIPIRVDRNKRSMYSVYGNASVLEHKFSRGNKLILSAINSISI